MPAAPPYQNQCLCGVQCTCNCGCSALGSCACKPGCKCNCPCADKTVPVVKVSSRIAEAYLRISGPMQAPPAETAQQEQIGMDKEVALAISETLRGIIDQTVKGIDWNWDIRGTDFGWIGKNLSFPGKPSEFPTQGLIGGILVKGEFATEPTEGQANAVTLEVGYYNKHKGGGGEYTKCNDLGAYDCMIGPDGKPDFSKDLETQQAQNLDAIGSGVKDCIDHIVKHPPDKAKSQSQVRKEFQKQEQLEGSRKQDEKWRQQLEEKRTTGPYRSIPDFFDHIVEETGGTYGPAELQRLMNTMFKSPTERDTNRKSVMDQLKDAGLTFDASRREIAVSPEDVAREIRLIADALDTAQQPSRELVVEALRGILSVVQ
jgi:hypothetical protein